MPAGLGDHLAANFVPPAEHGVLPGGGGLLVRPPARIRQLEHFCLEEPLQPQLAAGGAGAQQVLRHPKLQLLYQVGGRGGHLQNFGIPLEFQIVGKSAISRKSWNSNGIPIPMIYIFNKISKSNPNPKFWFSIISQSKSQLISEIFGFPIPTYFPTFSVDLFPNSKLS